MVVGEWERGTVKRRLRALVTVRSASSSIVSVDV